MFYISSSRKKTIDKHIDLFNGITSFLNHLFNDSEVSYIYSRLHFKSLFFFFLLFHYFYSLLSGVSYLKDPFVHLLNKLRLKRSFFKNILGNHSSGDLRKKKKKRNAKKNKLSVKKLDKVKSLDLDKFSSAVKRKKKRNKQHKRGNSYKARLEKRRKVQTAKFLLERFFKSKNLYCLKDISLVNDRFYIRGDINNPYHSVNFRDFVQSYSFDQESRIAIYDLLYDKFPHFDFPNEYLDLSKKV